MKTEMKAELIISGGCDFNPDRLNAIIGLTADHIWHIDDAIGKSIRKRDSNAWVISTGYLPCISLRECIVALLKKIESFEAKLRSVINSTVETQFSIAIYVHETVPELNLSKDLLAKLVKFGASLDIDVIVLNEPTSQP